MKRAIFRSKSNRSPSEKGDEILVFAKVSLLAAASGTIDDGHCGSSATRIWGSRTIGHRELIVENCDDGLGGGYRPLGEWRDFSIDLGLGVVSMTMESGESESFGKAGAARYVRGGNDGERVYIQNESMCSRVFMQELHWVCDVVLPYYTLLEDETGVGGEACAAVL